ncbi:MAG: protein-export chaperone SecB [Rhizobiaceae bacterium]
MAKEPKKNETEENGAAAENMAPQMNVLAQYVKDFSFENPHAPNSLRPREKAPDISININVNPNPLSETDFEVELKLDAQAVDGEEVMFNVELVYAGVFRLQGIPKEAIQAAVLVECPRMLFPFARQIIADASRNGSFPPLMIDPVDFAALFRQRMAEAQKQQEQKKSDA